MNDLRTPIARARGLGSAKDGTGHFWTQRLSAVALVPLTIWFVWGLAGAPGASRAEALAWIGAPINAVLMVLLLLTLFWHSMLGLQVIVEDYVHSAWLKLTTLVLLRFAHLALAAAGVYAVLYISFGGTA
jgi:succinate dehydrogenase / fumarate reductase, membrane anchor subunit